MLNARQFFNKKSTLDSAKNILQLVKKMGGIRKKHLVPRWDWPIRGIE